jgi:hypothetical protein
VQQERSPFPALPDGWSVIGRCRFGTGGPGPNATGCYALAHPRVGVALIDIVPNTTPNAEARLRRALTAVEFWPDFPGTLPVVHDRLDTAALRSLPWVLERWFVALPALTVPGGSAWIEGVRRAMAVDPAWELPGQPKAMPDTPPDPASEAGAAPAPQAKRAARASSHRPHRWGRVAVLPLAFAAVFGLGLVSGFLLLESPAPVDQATLAAAPAPQAATGAPGPAAAAVSSDAAPKLAGTTAATAPVPAGLVAAAEATRLRTEAMAIPSAPAEPAAPGLAAPAAAQASAPATPTAVAAVPAPVPEPAPLAGEAPPPAAAEGPAVRVAAGPVVAGINAMAVSPFETPVLNAPPVGEALPLAPPRAPAPPVRVSSSQPPSRPAPVIDRACSQALFRFQQGERLTAAEQNFLRTGCSTARR